MLVKFARALAVVIGVLLAGQALAQDDSMSSRRDRDPVPNRRDRDSFASLRDQIIRPDPPSSYYAQSGSDDRYFNIADEVQPPAPVEAPNSMPVRNGGTPACASCAAAAASNGNLFANSCGVCDECDALDGACASCDNCPCSSLIFFSGIDSWRGIGDRGASQNNLTNNNGGSTGVNYGQRLGAFSDATGIALQVGGSYGIYDWSGRPANAGTLNTVDVQQQGFFTLGAFKRANDHSNFSYGVVHDWMFNQNWGATAINPTLGQWRGQLAYATSAWNEFGAWGTYRDKGDSNVTGNGTTVFTRSINQVNAFWHHKYDFGGDSWIWVGVPQDSRLDHNLGGNLGDFLVGGSVIAPLSDYVSLYGNMQYMHPSSRPGSQSDGESAWYVAFGLQWYVGGHARSTTVAGQCWQPLLPVANNGSFLVDSANRGPT